MAHSRPSAADTVSITVMEIVDNGVVLLMPGAMEAGLGDFLLWWSLAVGLFIACWAAFPVNRARARPRDRARLPLALDSAGAALLKGDISDLDRKFSPVSRALSLRLRIACTSR